MSSLMFKKTREEKLFFQCSIVVKRIEKIIAFLNAIESFNTRVKLQLTLCQQNRQYMQLLIILLVSKNQNANLNYMFGSILYLYQTQINYLKSNTMSKIVSETTYNITHGIFLVMNLVGFGWFCTQILSLHYLVKFFSVQAFQLAILYSIISMFSSLRSSRINQVLYELSFTSNLIACLGYWIMVRGHVISTIPYSFLLCNDFTHTMPILMLVFIHYSQKLEYFHLKNLKYQAYLLIFAIIVNIIYAFLDKPVYPFLTYQDVGTAIFLIGGSTLLLLIYLGMMKLTTWRSKRSKVQ